MPTYLCHGFRWQRRSIRVYVVVQNLDDASPEWIIPAKSSQCILESFYNLFEFLPYRAPPSRSSGGWSAGPPLSSSGGSEDDDNSVFNTAAYTTTSRAGGRSRSQSTASQSQSQSQTQSRSQSQSRSRRSLSRSRAHSNTNTTREEPPPPLPILDAHMSARGTNHNGREDDISSQDWSVVKLLEEYDPMNLDEVSRPYAYVADYVKRIDLSVSIFEEIQKYEEQVRANRDDPPMVLTSGGASSDETARGNQKSSSSSSSNNKKKPGAVGSGWFEQMRDQLQRGEEIRWYVVVNGDEVRDWPDEPVRKPDLLSAQQRPTPTKEQMQHHRQYMLQQQIFQEKDISARRRLLEGGGGGAGRPAVPEKDVPLPGTRLRGPGMVDQVATQKQQQKSQSKGGGGGFRRLFGRNVDRPENYYSP